MVVGFFPEPPWSWGSSPTDRDLADPLAAASMAPGGGARAGVAWSVGLARGGRRGGEELRPPRARVSGRRLGELGGRRSGCCAAQAEKETLLCCSLSIPVVKQLASLLRARVCGQAAGVVELAGVCLGGPDLGLGGPGSGGRADGAEVIAGSWVPRLDQGFGGGLDPGSLTLWLLGADVVVILPLLIEKKKEEECGGSAASQE